jgi:hypothetical protein
MTGDFWTGPGNDAIQLLVITKDEAYGHWEEWIETAVAVSGSARAIPSHQARHLHLGPAVGLRAIYSSGPNGRV